jgi:hypothetical protein
LDVDSMQLTSLATAKLGGLSVRRASKGGACSRHGVGAETCGDVGLGAVIAAVVRLNTTYDGAALLCASSLRNLAEGFRSGGEGLEES